jgi:hypothetical protein
MLDLGMSLSQKSRAAPPDYYVDTATGSDLAAGTIDAPFATLTKLNAVIAAMPAGLTTTALIRAGTYSDDNFTLTATGVIAKLIFEPGCTMQATAVTHGDVGASSSAFDAGGTSTIYVYGNGLHITGWKGGNGTGNGLGASGSGRFYAYDCVVDDCIDGFSVHNSSYGEVWRCTFNNCSKSCVAHVNTASAKHYDCVFTADYPTAMTGGMILLNTSLRFEFHRCRFVPTVTNSSGIGISPAAAPVDAYFKDCELGTLTLGMAITSTIAVGAVFEDCFVNVRHDAQMKYTMRRCYGKYTLRTRGTPAPGHIILENCIFGGQASGSAANSLIYMNSALNASPLTLINTIITGYATAIGSSFTATDAQQLIDAPLDMHHCCLFGNTLNFDADVTADDGFAAAVHDNITADPLLGPRNTTAKSAWGFLAGSPCIGAGAGGADIGFAAAA